jgi:hypothetical protein
MRYYATPSAFLCNTINVFLLHHNLYSVTPQAFEKELIDANLVVDMTIADFRQILPEAPYGHLLKLRQVNIVCCLAVLLSAVYCLLSAVCYLLFALCCWQSPVLPSVACSVLFDVFCLRPALLTLLSFLCSFSSTSSSLLLVMSVLCSKTYGCILKVFAGAFQPSYDIPLDQSWRYTIRVTAKTTTVTSHTIIVTTNTFKLYHDTGLCLRLLQLALWMVPFGIWSSTS